MVVKWTLTDVFSRASTPYSFTFPINPNEGGTLQVEKQMNVLSHVGPKVGGILQEGGLQAPKIAFGGVILTQTHLEQMEIWFTKRVLLDLVDDLFRQFRGVLTRFEATRSWRSSNVWYHTFSAEFTVWAYKNAAGVTVYGTFTTPP